MKYLYKSMCCMLLVLFGTAQANNNIIINGIKIEFDKNDTVIITNLTNKTIEPIIVNDENIKAKLTPNNKLFFFYKKSKNKVKDENKVLNEEQKKALEELIRSQPKH